MAYTATYAPTDFVSMIYDLLGTIFAALIANATVLVTLIILVIIVEVATKLLKGTFNVFAWFGKK